VNIAFSAISKVTTSKFTAKLLLLSHSENYTFVVVSHKIFLARLFCAPLPVAPLSHVGRWRGAPTSKFVKITDVELELQET